MSVLQSSPCSPLASFVFAVLLLGSGAVHATTFTVGTSAECTHATLQSAVDAAAASSLNADQIRVTTAVYTQQQVAISTLQELDITGGYSTCSAATPTPNSRSTLDGNGGSARPVLRIAIQNPGIVRLRNLEIRRGDQPADAEGGGIYYEGDGRLEIRDTRIVNNVAGYGGGLYAVGTGFAAIVEFGENVTVSGNTARQSGGGVYVKDVDFRMVGDGSGIFLNEALGEDSGGFGGGLMVLGNDIPFNVYIGDAGIENLGLIFNNKAKYGGGIALVGVDGSAHSNNRLVVHSKVAGRPAGIRDNVARVEGGGLYVRADEPVIPLQGVYWNAHFWNVEFDGNTAPDGAAIYADGDGGYGVELLFNSDTTHYGAPAPADFVCAPGQFCGGIVGNVAQNPDGTPTDGAVVHMIRKGMLAMALHLVPEGGGGPPRGGMVVEGNRGGRLIFVGDEQRVHLENVLIADNQVGRPLIDVEGNSPLSLIDATLAGTDIAGGNPVLKLGNGPLELARSIVWQPGSTILQCSGCSKTFERSIASERDSLDGGNGSQLAVAEPRFLDPVNGDYQLRAASTAVDYAPVIDGNDRDTLGRARDFDLPVKAGAFGGVRDIGAFERQSLQPLVLNSDVDVDTRLWEPLVSGVLSRDTLNASGGPASGSLRVTRTNATPGDTTVAAKQCIHLPGPARYLLNGWGRTGTPGGFPPPVLDTAQLRWELRHNGGEDCTGGTVAAGGTMNLSIGDWFRPDAAGEIEVTPDAWTIQTSLVVYLQVNEASTTRPATTQAWFDGITLQATGLGSGLFDDGFE